MKKILIFPLTFVLILCCSITAPASTGYVDFMAGKSDFNNEGDNKDISMKCLAFGLEGAVEGSWRAGVDCFYGLYREDIDFSGILVKGGYALVNNDPNHLELNLGYALKNISHVIELSSLTVGISGAFNLNDRNNISFFLNYGIEPRIKVLKASENVDGMLYYYRLKYDYFINEDLGIGIGYRGIILEEDNSSDKWSDQGLFIGLTSNF